VIFKKNKKIVLAILSFLILISITSACESEFQEKGFGKSAKPQVKVLGADVYAWFPDGEVKKITNGKGTYVHPSIHPEGEYVLFNGGVEGTSKIFKANLLTGLITQLTPFNSSSDNALFSWQGDKIIFCSDRKSNEDPATIEDVVKFPPPIHGCINVFTMDLNGENVVQVTFGEHQDQRPCISTDGKTIVFCSNRETDKAKFRLWSVPTDGSAEPKLLNADLLAYRPWFSKDGNKLYFFTDVNGRHQICSATPEAQNVTPLLNDDKGLSHGPFVDPSGNILLMHSNRSGLWQSWELPLDGISPVRLLEPPGFTQATHPTRAKNGVVTFDVWNVVD